MPTASTLLTFTIAALAPILLPGPGILLILARGVGFGRRVAVGSTLGLETATSVYVAATAAGLSALLASSALAFSAVRCVGAAYLVIVGLRTLIGRNPVGADLAPDQPSPPRLSAGRAYRQGFLVGITNPKVAIFFVAFFPQFVDSHRAAAPQVLVLGAIFVALALAMEQLVASAAGSVGGWLARRPSFARRQRYVTGTIYLVLGAAAAAGPTRG